MTPDSAQARPTPTPAAQPPDTGRSVTGRYPSPHYPVFKLLERAIDRIAELMAHGDIMKRTWLIRIADAIRSDLVELENLMRLEQADQTLFKILTRPEAETGGMRDCQIDATMSPRAILDAIENGIGIQAARVRLMRLASEMGAEVTMEIQVPARPVTVTGGGVGREAVGAIGGTVRFRDQVEGCGTATDYATGLVGIVEKKSPAPEGSPVQTGPIQESALGRLIRQRAAEAGVRMEPPAEAGTPIGSFRGPSGKGLGVPLFAHPQPGHANLTPEQEAVAMGLAFTTEARPMVKIDGRTFPDVEQAALHLLWLLQRLSHAEPHRNGQPCDGPRFREAILEARTLLKVADYKLPPLDPAEERRREIERNLAAASEARQMIGKRDEMKRALAGLLIDLLP